MLYNLFSLVLDTVAGLFAGVLLLRFWMQIVRVRPPQQIAQFTFQLTDWLVKPLRRVIPGVGGFDWASVLGAYAIALLATAIKVWMVMGYLPASLFLLALFSVLQWIIYGWTALLVFEVIFSWINPHAPLAPFVQALNAPLLRPIRQVLPLLGGLDISPMVLFLLLQFAGKMLAYLFVMSGMIPV
ncbi:YggT family protein [Solimicrobium silvestre]|uniref:YGGT family n=1 Tax=Solimicrobium silvestre TaxID=2099400 RepID=A0A2S9GUI9_9BURK|nr:YggT family protein [Solimicrobium silvestre]PRC91374.1 YGGT family [Solimicrobium silvestre]